MIYLDNAATSFQKPPSVGEAMRAALQECSSPGRGGYPAAARAAETAYRCREAAAELFHLSDPERVVFTFNATHGLNLAIKSLVRPGSRVVISGYEHNAVTRPLAAADRVETVVAESPLFDPAAAEQAFRRAVRPGDSAVICSCVSNVFGTVLPVERIAALCRERGVPLILDASQSAGVLPLDVGQIHPAFVAMPGHKGLYGPQGTGLLLCGEGVPVTPLLEGGTGSLSLQQTMPEFLPDRLEAGTHNMPGIAGLLAGIRFVVDRGIGPIREHERSLALTAAEGLRHLPGIEVFYRDGLVNQCGVLSFREQKRDPEETAAALAARGIAVRAGFHCAPLAHRTAGTLDTGTVRVSFSPFNTERQVYSFLAAMREIRT